MLLLAPNAPWTPPPRLPGANSDPPPAPSLPAPPDVPGVSPWMPPFSPPPPQSPSPSSPSPPFLPPPLPSTPPPSPPPSPPPQPKSPPPPAAPPHTCNDVCYLRSGYQPCAHFLHTTCSSLAQYAAENCLFKNHTSNPTACAGCCSDNLPVHPPSPLQPPPPPKGPPAYPSALHTAASVCLGAFGVTALSGLVWLFRRWWKERQRRAAVRHLQLNELGTCNGFIFGRSVESNTTALLGNGHASSSTAPGPMTTPLSTKDINVGATGGPSASAVSSAPLAPLDWTLSVTSPNASTC